MGQGTDSISRSQFKEGVTSGKNMLYFIPIAKSALDVYSALKEWISTLAGNSEVELLSLRVGSKGFTIIWGGHWIPRGFGGIGLSREILYGLLPLLLLKQPLKNFGKPGSNTKILITSLLALGS